ncbi:MAG: BrnT family toxin [Phycisphaerales bacterium]|nr:BrnT family toxin [Phycisphaerales bacterium]
MEDAEDKPSDFEYDLSKDAANQLKHGVAFIDAERAFADPRRLIVQDVKHSAEEQRYYCFGLVQGEVMTVRFTYRGNRIRIFGAGYWRDGKRRYEKERPNQA